MPLYQFYCESCDDIEDRVCPWEEKRSQVHSCGTTMVGLISSLTLVGPTPTKPEKCGGKLLESASAVRQYERENQGLIPVSRHDRVVKDKLVEMRHLRDLRAMEIGYRSEKHRIAEVKKMGNLP